MVQLFDNGFLLALGKAIAASIWQMGLLWLVYHFIISILKIKQAAPRNLLSTIFSLGGFLWFISGFIYYINKGAATSIVIENTTTQNQLLQQFTANNEWQLLINWLEFKLNLLLPYLSVAYLIVLFWFATRLLLQFKQTNALRHNGILPVQEQLQLLVNTLAQNLELNQTIKTFISYRIDIPATIGFLKPVILLPATAVTHLSPAQLEAVLLHELAHIRRNDYFWNLLLSISETLLFFNPFALLLIGVARRERENCCDDVVMHYKKNAADYAEALLNVEKARLQTPQLVMALGDNKYHLKHRVKRILNMPVEKNKFSTRLLALLFLTVVFALMGWVLQNKEHAFKTNDTSKVDQPNKRSAFFISPDALVKKENKTIAVRDNSKKLNLQISKEKYSEKLILLNEEGKQFEFDKLVFEGLPEEWLGELIPVERSIEIPPGFISQKQLFQRQHDSLIYQQREQQYKQIKEQYVQNLNRNKRIRVQMPQDPYIFYFKENEKMDSVLEHYSKQHFGFIWNGESPFDQLKEKQGFAHIVKQNNNRKLKLAELRNKARNIEINRFEKFDTATFEKRYFEQLPQEWTAFIEQRQNTNEEPKQLTIVIEDNKVFINGRMVHGDSSIQQLRRKTVKVAEMMRL